MNFITKMQELEIKSEFPGVFRPKQEKDEELEIKSENGVSLPKQEKDDELEIKSEYGVFLSKQEKDVDSYDKKEVGKLFGGCRLISEETVAPEKYILQISATLESSPNVALGLSDHTCAVYSLSNNQFAKLAVLSEHTDVISEVKFSSVDNNLVYTSSYDGRVKLWDLRAPQKSSATLKDSAVNKQFKQITCFDASPNNFVLAAGTNLFEGDSFILFWDIRKRSLLGGYWESHTNDITQVKFHPQDSNKLISGSTDGLINIYDIIQSSEDDALTDTLNTESSVEKLTWIQDIIACVTHTADVQFWKIDDAEPHFHLHRPQIAENIERKSEGYVYVVDVHPVHPAATSGVVLAGSNHGDGEYLMGLTVTGNTVVPTLEFPGNTQRVRSSWFNPHTNLLLTGGEKGVINAWEARLAWAIPKKEKKEKLK